VEASWASIGGVIQPLNTGTLFHWVSGAETTATTANGRAKRTVA
jgi:hypothetical protein